MSEPSLVARARAAAARLERGEHLSADELARVVEDARLLGRRLDRLRALDPDAAAGVELHPALARLLRPVCA